MRHYIGVTSEGPKTLRNIRQDMNGDPVLLVKSGETQKLRINFADWLEGAETISSVTNTARNCTVSQTLSSPNLDLTISAVTSRTSGSITLTATSSTGNVMTQRINVRQPERFGEEYEQADYA